MPRSDLVNDSETAGSYAARLWRQPWKTMADLAEPVDDLICSFDYMDSATDNLVLIFIWGLFSIVLIGIAKWAYSRFAEKNTKTTSDFETKPSAKTNDDSKKSTANEIINSADTVLATSAKVKSGSFNSFKPSKQNGFVPATPPVKKRLGRMSHGTEQLSFKKPQTIVVPTCTGSDAASVEWVNELLSWLFNDRVIVNDLVQQWIESMNEFMKKSVEEQGIGVELVRALDSHPPSITNVFCECDSKDDVTITWDCEATPAFQLKAFSQRGEKVEVSYYRVNVNRFRARLTTVCITDKLIGELKCDGWPEVKVALAPVGPLKPNTTENNLQQTVSEVVVQALRSTHLEFSLQPYPTCLRLRRHFERPGPRLPLHYDSMLHNDRSFYSSTPTSGLQINGEKRLLDKNVSAKDIGGAMGTIPRKFVVSGPRREVPVAPLTKHLAHLANDDRTALSYADETSTFHLSYAKLHQRTNMLARALVNRIKNSGGKANRNGEYVVAVCMRPSHNTITCLLSIWKAGSAYVPMEPSFPQARITHILTDAEPALVVYDDAANPSMFLQSGVPPISFEELMHEARSFSAEDVKDNETLSHMRADSIAIVLYTSGSTGIPKGVRLPYAAICNRLWWQFRTFPYSDTEHTCVWKTALTFFDSVCEIFGPLLHGRRLMILSKETTRDPQKLVRILTENEIERLVLVPTLLRSILLYLSLNSSKSFLRRLKLWVCSGETLSKDLVSQFFEYFGDHDGYRLANFYGSTEVTGDVTFYVLEKFSQLNAHPTIPIGAPLDNCAIYLLDEEMHPARESEPGELWVAGANLAEGYIGSNNNGKFTDNPHAHYPDFSRLYRTGDFGILSKGSILFAGRTDSQVKVRGHRVDLQEVERAVNGIKGIETCVVLCYGLDRGNPEILAFVTLQPDARLSARNIENLLKDSLTSYMMPQVQLLDSIPLLVNGKVDRQALLKSYENTNNNDDAAISLDIDYTDVGQEDMQAAKVLLTTVGEVLGRSVRGTLSLRSGFYTLGGNSLNSILTITLLRERGYYIDISDFLEASTLGEVLSKLSRNPLEQNKEDNQFVVEPMRDEHREPVIEMIISSFYEKAEFKLFPKIKFRTTDYVQFVKGCWKKCLQTGLSVVLTDESGSLVAVALNFDGNDEPDLECVGSIDKIMTFLEHIEGNVRHLLPTEKGTVLHAEMMATASHLSPKENVAAIKSLEYATLKIAKDRGFRGVFTTNTSPLTQQLGRDVLGFQTLLDYQINQYVDPEGNRLFGEIGDEMRAIICWKPID